ncbi:MAG TPA: CBS domain-containing protein [Pyrinomonadaceae bacterium]|nr:CBS domain-containing protein [Pyrinomonadaceae bacterium]
MKVKEVMTLNAKACTPTTSLAEAAGLMWENDCGVLPVVAGGGKVVGIITDRDICMSAFINNRNLSNIAVEDVISGKVYSTGPEVDIAKALETMRERKVRRLAVVDAEGGLEGILSLNDIVLKAREAKGKQVPGVAYKDIVDTFKAICSHNIQSQPAKSTVAGV